MQPISLPGNAAAALTAFLTLLTLAAAPPLSAATPAVEKALSIKYPGAGPATWDLGSDGYWEATFERNGIVRRADFTAKGEWVKTEISIPYEDLPTPVQEAVEQNLGGKNIAVIESVDHAMHGTLYSVWIEESGKLTEARFRENGSAFGEILKLRDPQKRFETMEHWEIARNFAFNLLTIILLAWAMYYRRHHDREMLFLLLGFNLFLFPIFLVSNNLSAGLGFTIFAVLALVRLRSDTFSKTEIAYLLGAVALTFINAQLAPLTEVIGATLVLVTAWAADHPRIWKNACQSTRIRYRIKDTTSMLNEETLRACLSQEYQIEVVKIKVESILAREVRLLVLYRPLPATCTGHIRPGVMTAISDSPGRSDSADMAT